MLRDVKDISIFRKHRIVQSYSIDIIPILWFDYEQILRFIMTHGSMLKLKWKLNFRWWKIITGWVNWKTIVILSEWTSWTIPMLKANIEDERVFARKTPEWKIWQGKVVSQHTGRLVTSELLSKEDKSHLENLRWHYKMGLWRNTTELEVILWKQPNFENDKKSLKINSYFIHFHIDTSDFDISSGRILPAASLPMTMMYAWMPGDPCWSWQSLTIVKLI